LDLSDWILGILTGLFLVGLFGSIIAFDVIIPNIRRKRALKTLPEGVRRLGLEYVESEYIGELGHIQGTYKDYAVSIRANGGPHYRIKLKHDTGANLRRAEPTMKPQHGQTSFDFAVPELDRLFGQRYAYPERAQWFASHGNSLKQLRQFAQVWRRKVSDFEIEEDRLECTPKKGQPTKNGPGSVLPEEIEALLPLLVAVARELDAHPYTGPKATEEEKHASFFDSFGGFG
jgi:hypothetical protein